MKYRKLDQNGDYTFGTGNDFYTDAPEAVAQAVKTRLLLFTGDWYLAPADGVPWAQDILGHHTPAYDGILKQTILETPGVTSLDSYSSDLDGRRRLTVTATINTDYGQAQVST